jgi:hypothetical protein
LKITLEHVVNFTWIAEIYKWEINILHNTLRKSDAQKAN